MISSQMHKAYPSDYPQEEISSPQLLAFRHLRRQPPPRLDPSNPSAEMKSALESIKTLVEDLCDSPSTVPDQRRTTAIRGMDKNWHNIWAWVSALVHSCVLEKEVYTREGVIQRERILYYVPVLLNFPFAEVNFNTISLRIVKNTPNFFHLIIKLWVWAMERSHTSVYQIAMAVDLYLPVTNYMQMANVAVSVPKSIPLALQYMCTIGLETEDLSGQAAAANFLGYISKASDTVLRTLLSQGALQYMMRALRKISLIVKSSKFPGDFRDTLDTLITCMKRILLFIRYAFEREGFRVFVVLFEHRFINAMINSSHLILIDESSPYPMDFPFTLSQIFHDLFQNVPSLMYFRSILNPIMRSLKRIAEDDTALNTLLHGKTASSHHQSSYDKLGTQWQRVIQQASMMQSLRRDFKNEGIVACGNIQVRNL